MYGIYEPGHFWNSDLPKLFLALILVVSASIAVFAYIIRGAFSISAKRKVKEWSLWNSALQNQVFFVHGVPICLIAVLNQKIWQFAADVVVYLQAKNPAKIFDLVPQIAKEIGLQSDEYGDYPYRCICFYKNFSCLNR